MQYHVNAEKQKEVKEKRAKLEQEFTFHLELAKTAGRSENWERFGWHMFKAGRTAVLIEHNITEECGEDIQLEYARDETLSQYASCIPIARFKR